MKKKTVSLAIGRMGVERWPEFNVVLAYDEFVSGISAKEFFESLVCTHGNLFQSRCQLWQFEVMGEPVLFEAAVQDASRADMIVIATRKSQFSSEVKQWIKQSFAAQRADCHRLVVLLSGKVTLADGESGGVRSRAAASGRNRCRGPLQGNRLAGDGAAIRGENYRRAAPGGSAAARASVSTDAVQPRWGLNE